jgi:methyl-accepting chemotaxis protein
MMKKNIWIVVTIVVALSLGIASCAPAPAVTANNQAAQDLLIKSEVETAVSMLQVVADKQQAGEMTLDEAKELGAELLRGMTYGTDGYFWADTEEGVNVVLYGRPDVEGRNRLNDEDGHGVYYVKEFIKMAQSGGGYLDYWFTKKGESTPAPKRSYVQLFKPFGWVVGTGYYK